MKARYPQLDWRIMDVRDLRTNAESLGGSGTWDVIIDKGAS